MNWSAALIATLVDDIAVSLKRTTMLVFLILL